jgi:hypothetical protein
MLAYLNLLPFQWKPIPANNKAEDLSRVDIEVEPSRPLELRPLRPKYFAVHYPVTPIDSYFKDSDKFFWGKVCYGSSWLRSAITQLNTAEFNPRSPTEIETPTSTSNCELRTVTGTHALPQTISRPWVRQVGCCGIPSPGGVRR